jgi:hypothetical protein
MAALDIERADFFKDMDILIFEESVGRFLEEHASPDQVEKWSHDGIVERATWREAGQAGPLCLSVPIAHAVVLSLPAEPSPGRGDAAGARHCRLLRDGETVGDEVRARLCQPPQAQESERPRNLAPRILLQPGARSCPRSSIARARASTTGPRTLTCLCDGVSGRCRAFDLQQASSGSSPSAPPSAISSSRPVPVATPIASTPGRNRRPQPASPPEPVRAPEIPSPRPLVS